MSRILLYSTNVFLKLLIQEKYRNDIHYVWCSERFDSRKLEAYSVRALIPPSSNPADIYRQLRRDVDGRDMHSAKIIAQKASFKSIAIEWEKNGEIASNDKEEIIYMVDTSDFELWKPLLYIIPYAPVKSRLLTVPISQRAGVGEEYIIPNLKRSEFDIIEF